MARSTAGNDPTRTADAGQPMPPLAFIYDRHATPSTGMMAVRIEGCREYAAELRYEVAGAWIDTGDHALADDHRPQFDAMLDALAGASVDRTVLCLVNGLDRISRDPGRCGHFRYRVHMAGGWTETTTGSHDRPGDTRAGALTEFPFAVVPGAAS
ncbi:recombinase family protein [Streptomyces sp. H10-C2]|uniref:recombinase family protein n=1 Tax=unclassified Streptomyces TaxID=2593676 RepID=UPI0024B8F3ED|nr:MULTISPECIES: recombinase family protein [unclassified Streptomyces]MDJ0345686.1 recombinase family protein [Streptomyces sp. PH10-H1]MDJ0374538.1 recombinase family protein [Streptomyces sp. H10-C2]